MNGISPAALKAMGPEEFAALVSDSISPDTDPNVWDALTGPLVIGRTRKCLGSLKADVQAQLSFHNAELERLRGGGCGIGDQEGEQRYRAAKSERADWRRRAVGFRLLVDKRIALVKSRMAAGPAQPPSPYGPGFTKAARAHNRAALEKLALAVAEHQRQVTSGDSDGSADEGLWQHLIDVTAITGDGEELPLGEWLEYLANLREDPATD